MQYKMIRVNQKGELLACPNCDNEELLQGEYCMICGFYINGYEVKMPENPKLPERSEEGKEHAI